MQLFGGRFNINLSTQKVNGAYGSIRFGTDKFGNQVAIKTGAPNSVTESKIMLHLSSLDCVPKLLWFGTYLGPTIVMTKHGRPLSELFGERENERTESKKAEALSQIMDSAISAFSSIHSLGIVHRDVKPDNLLICEMFWSSLLQTNFCETETNQSEKHAYDISSRDIDAWAQKHAGSVSQIVTVIDFGMSTVRSDLDLDLNQNQKSTALIGTPRFASLNAHLCTELDARDDMESLGYSILSMCAPLPWDSARSETQIEKCKLSWSVGTTRRAKYKVLSITNSNKNGPTVIVSQELLFVAARAARLIEHAQLTEFGCNSTVVVKEYENQNS